jgi:hypothetical protein
MNLEIGIVHVHESLAGSASTQWEADVSWCMNAHRASAFRSESGDRTYCRCRFADFSTSDATHGIALNPNSPPFTSASRSRLCLIKRVFSFSAYHWPDTKPACGQGARGRGNRYTSIGARHTSKPLQGCGEMVTATVRRFTGTGSAATPSPMTMHVSLFEPNPKQARGRGRIV